MTNILNIGIVGATGIVGLTLSRILEDKKWPIANITFFGRNRAEMRFQNKTYITQPITPQAFEPLHLIFSAATSTLSKEITQYMQPQTYLIDKTSAFRMQPDIPLIVPEINQQLIANHKIIASPNCIAVPLSLCLHPLSQSLGIESCFIPTYQSVSGAGKTALTMLSREQKDHELHDKTSTPFFNTPIHMNVIPHIDTMHDTLWTEEEIKIEQETNKILGTAFPIHASCVRVGVPVGHAGNVTVTLKKPVIKEQLLAIYEKAHTVRLIDGINRYLTPRHIVGTEECYLCRLRIHPQYPNVISFWFVCDNLRKGSALNAVQIGEHILEKLFPKVD